MPQVPQPSIECVSSATKEYDRELAKHAKQVVRRRWRRRGESVLEFLGGIVVLLVIGGVVWWFVTGKNPLAPSIVGKWQLDTSSSNTIEFFPDGTLRESALLRTSNGKYTLLDGGRLKMETEGILWGTNVSTWKYTINGDKLTMTMENGLAISLNWTRMK